MAKRPEAYAWSSYRALAGLAPAPAWLDAQPLYTQLAPGKSAAKAAAKYTEFVAQGKGVTLWDDHLRQQIYLGDDDFIARMHRLAGIDSANPQPSTTKSQISRIHTRAPQQNSDLQRYAQRKAASKEQRNQHIADAFYQGGHSQTAIALAFSVSGSTVSRVVVGFERQAG